MDSKINAIDEKHWACSLMDRMPGFGPVDRGSNPRRLITIILINYNLLLAVWENTISY